MKLAHKIALGAVVLYYGAGLAMGSLMASAIPAMNVLGVAYYAAVWPGFVAHGFGLTTWSPPVPSWSFSF